MYCFFGIVRLELVKDFLRVIIFWEVKICFYFMNCVNIIYIKGFFEIYVKN